MSRSSFAAAALPADGVCVSTPKPANPHPPRNAVHAIFPYRSPRDHSLWVFDDERFGLSQEPFVCGASEAIERVVHRRGLGDRLRAIFSATPLPDADAVLRRVGTGAQPELGGCNYHDGTAELWLCPAMTYYLGEIIAPAAIYVKLENAVPAKAE